MSSQKAGGPSGEGARTRRPTGAAATTRRGEAPSAGTPTTEAAKYRRTRSYAAVDTFLGRLILLRFRAGRLRVGGAEPLANLRTIVHRVRDGLHSIV